MHRIETPLGCFVLAATERGLSRVQPADSPETTEARARPGPRARRHEAAAARALGAYFAGARLGFRDLPLDPGGTPFERRVWRALLRIPFGETRSYGAIAGAIGAPAAARAVGRANGRNPLAIVVPCHRVIGADGRLTGYAGGLDRKRWLLAHEAR